MNRWVAWGLALVLAGWVARTQMVSRPDLNPASSDVLEMESSDGSMGPYGHPPVRPSSHGTVFGFALELGLDTAWARPGDGYAGPGDSFQIVREPVGPGPPAGIDKARLRPSFAEAWKRSSSLVPPSRSFLRRV